MQIKAQFKCMSVTKHEGGSETVVFMASNKKNEDNESWAKYTPNGEIKMNISQEGAVNRFAPGCYYSLTFEVAE